MRSRRLDPLMTQGIETRLETRDSSWNQGGSHRAWCYREASLMNQPTRATLDSVDLWTDVARDLWQVEMPTGGICAMGIEELDAAFERGEIGLQTRVQRPSGGDWSTLAEAAGVVDDSIRPVASEIELIDIPRPPPLPRRIARAAEADLTSEELSALPKRSKTGSRLAAVAAIGLLAGGLVAWRYMPAHPIAPVASTTIPAPTTLAAAAPQPAATLPAPPPSPETSPAPEGNALGSTVANVTAAIKAPLTTKKAPASKKTTWKHRVKLNAKKKHA